MCLYENIQSLVTPTRPPSADIKSTLSLFYQQLYSNPNILGSIIYHIRDGLINHQMPDSLNKEDLILLAQTATRCMSLGNETGDDIVEAEFSLPRHAILVFYICDQIYFILVTRGCEIPADPTGRDFHDFFTSYLGQIKTLFKNANTHP